MIPGITILFVGVGSYVFAYQFQTPYKDHALNASINNGEITFEYHEFGFMTGKTTHSLRRHVEISTYPQHHCLGDAHQLIPGITFFAKYNRGFSVSILWFAFIAVLVPLYPKFARRDRTKRRRQGA